MAFRIYEVVHFACQSRSWFVYAPKPLTSHANDLKNAKSHVRKKPLLAGYPKSNAVAKRLCCNGHLTRFIVQTSIVVSEPRVDI